MRHTAEIFCHGAKAEKILSAFTEAVEVTVYQKISHR
jgi:hypothetical protein